jgi:trimeric autotransporter adhesin
MKRTGFWALLLAPAVVAGSMLAAAPAADAATGPGVITTVAGGPGQGPPRHIVQGPESVAAGPGGSVDVGDYGVVRQINATASYESVVAGIGSSSPGTGDGGPATRAHLSAVAGLAFDHAGNTIIADINHCRIRVVAAKTGIFYGQAMTAGDIYTVAGNGACGYFGNGIPALAAGLSGPRGVAVDQAGNVLIADSYSDRIRVIAASTGRFYGQPMKADYIYTIAGSGSYGSSGDTGPATAADLAVPEGVGVDAAGNVLIAGNYNNEIRVVAARTGTYYGQKMTAGDIYRIAGEVGEGGSGNGGPATVAHLRRPFEVAADRYGNVVIADTGNSWVRVVAEHTGIYYGQHMTAGDIYRIATVWYPYGLALDAAGNVLAASPGGAEAGKVVVVAGSNGSFYGRHMTAGGTYTVAGQPGVASGEGRSALDAQLSDPEGVAVGPAGGLLITAAEVPLIRMTARASGRYYGVAMTAGNIYTVAGDGKFGFSGDGGPATSAKLSVPDGIVMDKAQNLILADYENERIRVVAASTGTFYGQAMRAADIYTIAGDGKAGYTGDGGPATQAELNGPYSVAVDAHGNVIIDDSTNRIRVVAVSTGSFYGQAMTAGDIYTIAGDGKAGYTGDGGPATQAELNGPASVAVGSGGTVLISDSGNQRIRAVATATGTFYGQAMTAGNIYTIAGDGTSGYSGDGGPATAAEVSYPDGISADSSGNVLIADSYNSRIRVVAAATGSFYGQAMITGNIYTVAGDGRFGFAGDGGKGVSAVLDFPEDVAATGNGDLVIADTYNDRVRQVSG